MNASINEFAEWLKEETLPGVWSKGVQYSRAVNSMEFVSNEKDEWKFKIKTQERLLAFTVTLWVKDQDSHCNCGSKVEPCHHIVAITLGLQNGTLKLEKSETQTRLEYQWKLDEKAGTIELIRAIVSDTGRSPLTQSLISYISGVQSGRLPGKLPATTSTDLKIDEILSRSTLSTRDLFTCLAELPPISGFSVEKNESRPRILIQDAENKEDGLKLTLIPLTPADATFRNGIERVGSSLRITSGRAPFQVPQQVSPSQFGKFLSESLPLLNEYFEVVNEATRLPKLVDRDPFIDYRLVPMKDTDGTERIAITPSISYGELGPNEIALPDKSQEQELMRDLRQNKNMAIHQTLYLSPAELFQRRGISPAVEAFSQNYFAGLMNELNVDFARVNLNQQGETILHLLSLREKGEFKNSAGTLARSLGADRTGAAGVGTAGSTGTVEKIPTQVPRTLWNQLRDYQKQGVYWLTEQNSAGAILADDMGLGKTVQTLSIVQSPTLIIAPTSLLHNWKDEAAKFRPDLRVNVFHGSQRAWDQSADLTITSYGILRSDLETFVNASSERPWQVMALDEAHQIRNQETLAAQAAYRVPAAMKIALTGTPVQNKRSDLFSLFEFISPGLFRSEAEMKPDLVSPFVLRRKKEDVLKELPPKTQMIHEIELREAERGRYQSVWAAAKAEIVGQLMHSDDGSGHSKKPNPLSMFEALLRARQACDHTGLFLESDWNLSSSKLNYLMQMIDDLLEAGHSVLVYSQWTKFLDRIEQQLDGSSGGASIPYERLDGSTTNRAQVVRDFQNSTEAKVFLLSLHAGGVGLNLTRASHVIFCDPWWNPFVELQAEDRAYRMGQEKPVTIHRLICNDTVEEKLIRIQKQKMIEAQGAIGGDMPAIAFTENDLMELLK
jgi:SNF2 family DNA or RNA helicase